ncbi:hypothetical protein BV25DRAFT_1832775, partial [Artomyces pyxidatus]
IYPYKLTRLRETGSRPSQPPPVRPPSHLAQPSFVSVYAYIGSKSPLCLVPYSKC